MDWQLSIVIPQVTTKSNQSGLSNNQMRNTDTRYHVLAMPFRRETRLAGRMLSSILPRG